MNIEVTNRERNELMNREDMELSINHTGEPTPSNDKVRRKLAAEQDLDPTTILVEHVYSSTGRGLSQGIVKVFDEPVTEELPEEESDAESAEDDASQEEEASEEASTEEEVEEADEDSDESSEADASQEGEASEEDEEGDN